MRPFKQPLKQLKMSGHNRWTSPCDCFCQKEELSGNVSDITRDGFLLAQDISSYSFSSHSLCETFVKSWFRNCHIDVFRFRTCDSNYNMMGIAKASLETAVKYLAFELAADKIRVNGISAGAIKTLAVTGKRLRSID